MATPQEGFAMPMSKSTRCRARAAVVAAAALTAAGLLNSPATQAGLVVDIRALTAPGGVISGGGKTVTFAVNTGQTVTLGVFARVTGTNSFIEVGDFDGQGDSLD